MAVQHRISAGAIVWHESRLLMVRHMKPGAYEFWVCPGGGVEADESLEAAAEREVFEETGLQTKAGPLAYIEELLSPERRVVKFWFLAQVLGGSLDHRHPEAGAEHIVEAAWRTPQQLMQGLVFPSFVQQRFFDDLRAGFLAPIRLPLAPMSVC